MTLRDVQDALFMRHLCTRQVPSPHSELVSTGADVKGSVKPVLFKP